MSLSISSSPTGTAAALETITLDLQRHTLANGLRVVLHRDPSLPLVAINVWYHVGSKNERPGRTGLAHLFEHLLFEGSENVGTNDHFRLVQQAGGITNGSTWFDRTNYYEVLPAHYLDLGLWLESDRMGFFLPALTQEKLDNQREVVINERRQKMDNQPYGCAFERLHELLYADRHAYRWPVIGYVEDLRATSMEDVSHFFRTFYVPSNAVLTVAGDIDYDHALERIEHYFRDIPAGEPIARPPGPTSAGLVREQRAVLPDNVQLPRIYMAFQTPPYGREAWYAADLLATALTEGKSSVLYEDLVYRRQLAQDVGCYLFPTEAASTFTLIATARPGVEPEILEAALSEHLERAATELLGDVDLERARNQRLTDHYSQLQTLDRRADLLSHFATFFDAPETVAAEGARYLELAADDLRRFAAEHLGREQRAVVTVVPRDRAQNGGQGS